MHKQNNLNALRLLAAGLVLYGHSFVFLGLHEPVFLSLMPLGTLGVYIFFTISGYLVAQSWYQDPNIGRFFARRALRIFPGLLVCTLLSVIVLGPLVTTLTTREYFSNSRTWAYFSNVILYITYHLPGVFEGNRAPNAVNGSLWSLPVEFLMYVVVGAVGLLKGGRLTYLILAIASAMLAGFWAFRTQEMLVVYRFDLRQVFMCGTYFWVGAAIYGFDLKKHLTISAAVIAGFAMLCLEPHIPTLRIAAMVFLPIVVLAFGFDHNETLARLTRHGDYSYGIYIYAFPVQQTIAYLWPSMPLQYYLLLSLTITMLLAAASWRLIESPALSLKPRKPTTPLTQ